MAAVPRRGRYLTGEVLGSDALALEVVCHLVSGDSIPNSVYERLGFLFNDFAAPIGGGDVAGGLAGNRQGGLLVEVGDGANPRYAINAATSSSGKSRLRAIDLSASFRASYQSAVAESAPQTIATAADASMTS